MSRLCAENERKMRRLSRGGWLVSSAVHVVALFLLGLWTITGIDPTSTPHLNSRWSEAERDQPAIINPPELAVSEADPSAGGAAPDFVAAEFLTAAAVDFSVHVPEPLTPSTEIPAETTLQRNAPLRRTKQPPTATGNGTGTGTGIGSGTGPGFFGIEPPKGQQIVFVVDNSRSMNHPHASEAKTRFRRLKMELVKCILEMQADQSFFVVFFSDVATPMPAAGPISSIPGSRDPYLRWIAEMNAMGAPTDPIPALGLALRLRPDVICFLTDGEFDKGIQRRLRQLQQPNTAIHTFAFGETAAEDILQAVAKNNSGEYRFIP